MDEYFNYLYDKDSQKYSPIKNFSANPTDLSANSYCLHAFYSYCFAFNVLMSASIFTSRSA